MSTQSSHVWDREAATFDEAADHGLRDLDVRRAWRALLLPLLPESPQTVADLGCGTGTLAVLLAQAGHHVHGVDFSAEMVRLARQKASAVTVPVRFTEGNAADPPLPAGSFDVVLSRHVLWAMPDPAAALQRWRQLLRPGGLLVLVEGFWSTGAGLTAEQCTALVEPLGGQVELRRLDDAALWGGAITDERYLVTCRWTLPNQR